MKKIFSIISIFVACFAFLFVIASCDNTTSNTDNGKQETSNVTPTNPDNSSGTETDDRLYCVVDFNSNGGSTITSQSVIKGGKVKKPSDPKKEGYTFDDWYYQGERWSFIGYTVTENMTLEARYTINKYTITIDNQAEGVIISGITSGNEYEYDSQITLTAVNNSGLSLVWEVNGNVEHIGNDYSFKVPENDVNIITTASSIYTRKDKKIYFGSYPQTKVTDNTLINELNTLAGTKPTSTNKYNWTDYNYYIEGKVASYMFYQDIDYDNNGDYDYRGVYFIQYRPYKNSSSSSIDDSFQDDYGYLANTIHWFSYDPIEWDILTESSGNALIIANLILDSQEYYHLDSTLSFSHNGGTGYANNYELSFIRKWLNDTFYNTAFDDLQKALIETTEVDNSASSTGNSSNSYACNNTNDKLFLLSYKEAETYYTSSTTRVTKGSDYARSQGLYVYSSSGQPSYWWLRSPCYSGNMCFRVDTDYSGYFGFVVEFTLNGIRPACWITL